MPQVQDRPEFSVIVASFSGRDALEACLKSIIRQSVGAEVIAATNLCEAECERLGRPFPDVHFVRAGRGSDVFRLRSLGIAAARGKWIALTEDHCVASPGWLTALREALGDRTIVAGPVLPDPSRRWTNRALFLCEYANLLPPLRADRLSFVSGVNAAYPRAALEQCRDVWQDGFYENEVSDALRSAGYRFAVAPEAFVHSRLTMRLRSAIGHFYAGGRRFGGYRAVNSAAAVRAIRLLITPAVPLVLLARILRNVSRRPGWFKASVLGVPVMLVLLVAWASGEAAGLLRGLRADESHDARGAPAADVEPA